MNRIILAAAALLTLSLSAHADPVQTNEDYAKCQSRFLLADGSCAPLDTPCSVDGNGDVQGCVPLKPGGAAGFSSFDPAPNWQGPDAVDFAGGTGPSSAGEIAYRTDRTECGDQVGRLPKTWDTIGIVKLTAQGGVTGAASGAPAAAVNPIAVAITAIAGAGSQLFNAVSNNLAFFPQHAKDQITVCMDRRSTRSGLYTVVQ